MTLHIIRWQSPSGKIVTSRPLTPAAARAEIEQNQQYTPDWRYTVEPPLDDLQAMLDSANARIVELEAVCREVVEALEISIDRTDNEIQMYINEMHYFTEGWGGLKWREKYTALRHLLDILPQKD